MVHHCKNGKKILNLFYFTHLLYLGAAAGGFDTSSNISGSAVEFGVDVELFS
jgi:hypothetical protein